MAKDNISVKVLGINEAMAKLKKYQVIKREASKVALMSVGFQIEAAAKQMAPVDFGRLRASISTNWSGSGIDSGKTGAKAEPGDGVGNPGVVSRAFGFSVVVGTNVTYAKAVEHGHVQTPGRFVPAIGKRLVASFVEGKPYLHPAYFMHEGEVIKRLSAVMKMPVKL